MLPYRALDPHIEQVPHLQLSQSKSTKDVAAQIINIGYVESKYKSDQFDRLQKNEKFSVDRVIIATHDEAHLETVVINPILLAKKADKVRSYVIKFIGNDKSYIDYLDQFAEDAEFLQSCIIGFDYRGVNRSTKYPERFLDLIVDGIAQVRRLLDLGVDSQNIILDGYSVGAMVATVVAAYFHYNDKKVNLWSDRSLFSFSLTGSSYLNSQLPYFFQGSFSKKLLEFAAKMTIGDAWDVKNCVIDAYKSIPCTHKSYMVISKKSADSLGDGVHEPDVQLHAAVKRYESDNNINTCNIVLAPPGLFSINNPGHLATRRMLLSKIDAGKTGQDLFQEFVISHRK